MRNAAAAFLLVSVLLAAAPARAGSIEVAPTTVDIADQSTPTTLYVTNRSDGPVAIQVEGFAWSQTAEGDQLVKDSGIRVSPPITRVLPGARQIVRVLIPGKSEGQQAYRVLVSELPDATPVTQTQAVHVLLQFSIPVFVGQNNAAPQLAWRTVQRNGQSFIAVTNNGLGRAKLADFDITRGNGKRDVVHLGTSRYVLAGVTREWALPKDVRAGERIRVEAKDARGGPTYSTTLTIAR